MGFDEGSIILDSPNDTYFAGQTLRGKLQFQLQKKKSLRGIYIDIEGYAKTHWIKTKSVKVNGKTTRHTVSYNGNEDYFNSRQYFVGGSSGELELEPGDYCYDFQFHLEPKLPSSFIGECGRIEYKMKVTVDRPWKFDQEKNHTFKVIAPLDLNLDPKCKVPIYIQLEDTYCCCWCKSGPVTTEVKLPMSGFIPDQVVPVEVYCQNLSNIEINKIKLILNKKTTFHVTSPSHKIKEFEQEVLVVKKGPIPVGTTRSWTIDYIIPEDVYNITTCRIIEVQHFFKVEVCTPGCHMNSDDSQEVFIGTVALHNESLNQPLRDKEIPNNDMKYPHDTHGSIQNMQQTIPTIEQQAFNGNNSGVVMPPYPIYPPPASYLPMPNNVSPSLPMDMASADFGWRTNPPPVVTSGIANEQSYPYNPDVVPPEKLEHH